MMHSDGQYSRRDIFNINRLQGNLFVLNGESSAQTQPDRTNLFDSHRSTPNFVGRDTELARLHKILQRKDAVVWVAVYGMGGVGKTQLAIEYAKSYQESYFPGGVCWLNAREDLASQIIQIAELDLQLPGVRDEWVRSLPTEELVRWCWRHWQPCGQVLVVLDDVPDAEHWAICQRFLPNLSQFRLLLTTRMRGLDANFVEIELDVLQSEAARGLLGHLEKLERVSQDPNTADELCEALGWLPLGIELVGRYLASDRFLTLKEMLGLLQAEKLRCEALERLPQYQMTAQLGVRAAFELTWKQLDEDSQVVARLLSLFAPDAIPWWLVEWIMQRVKGEEYLIRKARKRLDNASVVQISKENLEVCRLHTLIQNFLAEKHRIAAGTTGDQSLLNAFTSILVDIAAQIPCNPTSQQILIFIPIHSHLQEVAQHHTQELQGEDLLYLFSGLAQFYEGKGLYAEAKIWYEKCLEVIHSHYESGHADVAMTLMAVARFYQKRGILGKVESLYIQSLEMWQRLHEDDHSDVANTLCDLAGFYLDQARLEEAESFCIQSLEMRKRLH
ncbi:NB-ARC domain-containing protein [Phormidesmis sp. 146-12]